MNPLKAVIPLPRFYYSMSFLVLLFCVAFFVPVLYLPAIACTIGFAGMLLSDVLLVFTYRKPIHASREMPSRLSLSDDNTVRIHLKNNSPVKWKFRMIDELPEQLQIRDFNMKGELPAGGITTLIYRIKPMQRGAYHFGHLHLFPEGPLGIISRHITLPLNRECAVYPSIIQMKAFELYTASSIATSYGIRKMRRIGLSYEFEQIKPYVAGDDVRQINWRSSAKTQNMMVNQFEDEKSQQVYCIIDKSRSMLMPFNGLSLLDYAINSSLVISNTALRRQDKAGLLTFSNAIGSALRADRSNKQLRHIMEALYRETERDCEANYELLYKAVRLMVKTRSLLFLFTNTESLHALKRIAPVLTKINRQHLLVVMLFENTELEALSRMPAHRIDDVFTSILASQTIYDKQAIALELNAMGIHTILCKPEELSMKTVNKYLEIKSRGLL